MIRVTNQRVGDTTEELPMAYHYVIAGQRLVFQNQVPALDAFNQGTASKQFSEMMLVSSKMPVTFLGKHKPKDDLLHVQPSVVGELQYEGKAQFTGAFRDVEYWRYKDIAQINVDQEPVCQVHFKENQIRVLNDRPFDEPLNLEVVTGPALILLLAEFEIYCLHAGAVSTAAGNVAFVAESGAGKSTLSAHVNDAWQQISDDILPLNVGVKGQNIEIQSDFPQLKLKNATVQVNPFPRSQRLDFIIRINPTPSDEITFRLVSRTDALLQVIRHTVGARLYDKVAMKIHSKFAKRFTGRVPMIELSYPRDKEQLPELREKIVAYLQKYRRSVKLKAS